MYIPAPNLSLQIRILWRIRNSEPEPLIQNLEYWIRTYLTKNYRYIKMPNLMKKKLIFQNFDFVGQKKVFVRVQFKRFIQNSRRFFLVNDKCFDKKKLDG